MIDQQFGRWTVIGSADPASYITKKSVPRWLCRCACGIERAVTQMSLRNGKSSSCGCLNKERSSLAHKKHGLSYSTEYTCWQSMRQRALNPNNERHASYFDRGISVCERWNDFEAFLLDMGPRPSPSHSIDRIENDDGYHPDNCRWALPREQTANRRCTRLVNVDGLDIPLSALATKCGIPANTLRARIIDLGWSLEKAMAEPVRAKSR